MKAHVRRLSLGFASRMRHSTKEYIIYLLITSYMLELLLE